LGGKTLTLLRSKESPPLLFFQEKIMSASGLFITFEGIEGCGKTTQVKRAADYLKHHHVPFLLTVEPGGTSVGKRVREMLLNEDPYEKDYKMYAEAELLLFSAARAQHVREVILPGLREGKVILCDRFSDATFAYQGFGRGLDLDFIEKLNLFSSAGLKPCLTFLFDLPVEDGLRRARERVSRLRDSSGMMNTEQLALNLIAAEDVFEQEDLEFHRKVREGYLFLAERNPERFRVIDASRDIETIHLDVCRHLETLVSKNL